MCLTVDPESCGRSVSPVNEGIMPRSVGERRTRRAAGGFFL